MEFPLLKASISQGSHLWGCPGSQDQWTVVAIVSRLSRASLLMALEAFRKGLCLYVGWLKPSSLSSQCLWGHLGPYPHWYHVSSCLCPDTNSRVSESLRSVFPEIHSDLASKEVPGHILLDIDNDTESTALWRKPLASLWPSILWAELGQASLCPYRQNSESFQWEKESLTTQDSTPTARGEGKGPVLKAEWPVSWRSWIVLFYIGQKSCQKR